MLLKINTVVFDGNVHMRSRHCHKAVPEREVARVVLLRPSI